MILFIYTRRISIASVNTEKNTFTLKMEFLKPGLDYSPNWGIFMFKHRLSNVVEYIKVSNILYYKN